MSRYDIALGKPPKEPYSHIAEPAFPGAIVGPLVPSTHTISCKIETEDRVVTDFFQDCQRLLDAVYSIPRIRGL